MQIATTGPTVPTDRHAFIPITSNLGAQRTLSGLLLAPAYVATPLQRTAMRTTLHSSA